MSAQAGPEDPRATGNTHHDDLLPLLLKICEDFFTHTSSATRNEVDTLLLAHDITGGPGWLIDMLALTRLRLQNPAHHHEPHSPHDG